MTTADGPRRMTVGDLRRASEALPDDAPAFVTVLGWDLDLTDCRWESQVITPPDADGPPWPTRPGLALEAGFLHDEDGDTALVDARLRRVVPPDRPREGSPA